MDLVNQWTAATPDRAQIRTVWASVLWGWPSTEPALVRHPVTQCQLVHFGMNGIDAAHWTSLLLWPRWAINNEQNRFFIGEYVIGGGNSLSVYLVVMGGGPRVVVSTAAFHASVRGSVPGLGGLKETKMFLPHPRVKVSIVGSLRDREVACSASDSQGSNFESCVWRTV